MELGLTHHEAAVVRGVPGRDVRRPDHDPGGEAAHDEAEEEHGERQAGAKHVSLHHRRQKLAGNCVKGRAPLRNKRDGPYLAHWQFRRRM